MIQGSGSDPNQGFDAGEKKTNKSLAPAGPGVNKKLSDIDNQGSEAAKCHQQLNEKTVL